MGERLRESGNEYGAVTGRPRRCGWYDAVAVRYSVRINGLDALALTKLDVLDGVDRLDICTAYRCGSQTLTEFPSDIARLAACKPVYETMAGWSSPTRGLRRFADLPEAARRYVSTPRRGLRRTGRAHLDRLRARRHHLQKGRHRQSPVANRGLRAVHCLCRMQKASSASASASTNSIPAR